MAFRGSNGLYLSRCNSCWNGGAYPDSVFVHSNNPNVAYSQWTPVAQANGKYSFQSDNGRFLARCNGCAPSSASANFAFVHEPNGAQAYAQWDVIYTNLPRLGTVQLQTDLGFLRLCPTCGGSTPSAVSVENVNDANTKWKLVRVGTKVAFQGSNGNYLSRCNGCWRGGASPDAAFVHLNNPSEPYSQWTPTKLANGKWSFRADTGKYLSRCNNCAPSNVPNLAFVHASGNSEPYEQFTLVRS